MSAPCAQVGAVVRFYHLSETSDFKEFAEIVTPDIKWRQRGLLQGKVTYSGAEEVHNALLALHNDYQDLSFVVNTYAEEEGRVVLFWTTTGTNRVGLFGMAPTFKRSTFSGISVVTLSPDGSGRIQEVVEYRQPTYEEMAAHLNRELPGPERAAVDRLLLRGHAAPKRTDGAQGSNYYCELPSTREVDPMWRVRAVQAATEWVESWTPGPDLENMVRADIEEYNIYSWPDFEQDVVGRDALEERRSRSSQDAVVIRDTIADSSTNVVAVHWFDFEQVAHGHGHQQPAAAAKAPQGAAGGAQGVPDVALPRQQPARSHEHGSVEMKDGHFRVHLSSTNAGRASVGSEDEGASEVVPAASRLHKYRGVTLFRLDEDCKLAWMVTFRELKASELSTFMAPSKQTAAAVGQQR